MPTIGQCQCWSLVSSLAYSSIWKLSKLITVNNNVTKSTFGTHCLQRNGLPESPLRRLVEWHILCSWHFSMLLCLENASLIVWSFLLRCFAMCRICPENFKNFCILASRSQKHHLQSCSTLEVSHCRWTKLQVLSHQNRDKYVIYLLKTSKDSLF